MEIFCEQIINNTSNL